MRLLIVWSATACACVKKRLTLRTLFAFSLCLMIGASPAHAQLTNGRNISTQHVNNQRTGWNDQEFVLSPETVSSSHFGLLFSRAVDDKIYGQPLYMEGITMPGIGQRNVVYVATASNTLYAFDADNASASSPLWKTSLLGAGEASVLAKSVGLSHRTYPWYALFTPVCGANTQSYTDMIGNVGVTGTPVIDVPTQTLYVVSKSTSISRQFFLLPLLTYHQRLHAIDLTTGRERVGWPVEIDASVQGVTETGARTIRFNPVNQNQRAALALWSPPGGGDATVLIAFASHGDAPPYHGWLLAYDGRNGKQVGAFNTTPEIDEMEQCGTAEGGGSIWQGGQGPTLDAFGNVYVMTGNGNFNPSKGDYGSSILKLHLYPNALLLTDYFTPQHWENINYWDADLGSAGVLLIPNTTLLAGAGKEGWMYPLDRNALGGLERKYRSIGFDANGSHAGAMHVHGSPVAWLPGGTPAVYVWPENDYMRSFSVDHAGAYRDPPVTGQTTLSATGCASTLQLECMPGGMLSISSAGQAEHTGIVWALLPDNANAVDKDVPGRLVAFAATPKNGTLEILWRSDRAPAYAAARAASETSSGFMFSKFNAPTVVNGHVYVSTFSNELRVYGLK